jgi:hypothetical protein
MKRRGFFKVLAGVAASIALPAAPSRSESTRPRKVTSDGTARAEREMHGARRRQSAVTCDEIGSRFAVRIDNGYVAGFGLHSIPDEPVEIVIQADWVSLA